MKIHQLELFYHLARNRGVSQAARALEKEQPTLSKQINELEDELRTRLYHRRPFSLTGPGRTLFRAIEPFFRDLPKLEAKIKGGDFIRIGASPIVLAHHLPAVAKEVRKQFPNYRLQLREFNQPQLEQAALEGDLDLAITLLPLKSPLKVFTQPLLRLPLVLLAPKSSPIRTAAQLWSQREITQPLICLTDDEAICREFQAGLRRLGVEWRPQIEVGSLELVARYVEEGYGLGLSVRIPGAQRSPGLRELELPGFEPLTLGLMWHDPRDKLLKAFREAAAARAGVFAGGN